MPASSTSGDAVSLSIEDTKYVHSTCTCTSSCFQCTMPLYVEWRHVLLCSKLRAKLGLKPLEVDTGPKEISSVEG